MNFNCTQCCRVRFRVRVRANEVIPWDNGQPMGRWGVGGVDPPLGVISMRKLESSVSFHFVNTAASCVFGRGTPQAGGCGG